MKLKFVKLLPLTFCFILVFSLVTLQNTFAQTRYYNPVCPYTPGSPGGTTPPGPTGPIGGVVNGVAQVPLYKQCDPRWGKLPYGPCGTICSSACGPSALAMVLSFYGKNTLPPDIVSRSVAGGFRICGSGTSWGMFSAVSSQYGMGATTITWEKAMELAGQAKPIIINVKGPSDFTSGGHFIVITGRVGDTLYFNDSGGRNVTQKSVSYTRQYWGGFATYVH